MNKTITVQAKIEIQLKKRAEAILYHLGWTPTQAINALYAQIVKCKGIPFELKRPNDITLKAIHELESGGGKTFANFHEMISDTQEKNI